MQAFLASFTSLDPTKKRQGFLKQGIVFPSDCYSKSDLIEESKVHHIPDKASCLPDCTVTIELWMAHISTCCQLYINPTLCNMIIDPLNCSLPAVYMLILLMSKAAWAAVQDTGEGSWLLVPGHYPTCKRVRELCSFSLPLLLCKSWAYHVQECIGIGQLWHDPEQPTWRTCDFRCQHILPGNAVYPGEFILHRIDSIISSCVVSGWPTDLKSFWSIQCRLTSTYAGCKSQVKH